MPEERIPFLRTPTRVLCECEAAPYFVEKRGSFADFQRSCVDALVRVLQERPDTRQCVTLLRTPVGVAHIIAKEGVYVLYQVFDGSVTSRWKVLLWGCGTYRGRGTLAVYDFDEAD